MAFITSKISDIQSDLDVLIMAEDPEFYKTGLKVTSVLKLTKVSTVRKDMAEGVLGEFHGRLRDEVNQKLKRIFEI